MNIDIIFITGPGGVGKTTLKKILIEKLKNLNIFDFDEGGVPKFPTIQWRIEQTSYWVTKSLKINKKPIIICGLVIPEEINVILEPYKGVKVKYVLLTINENVLINRLKKRNWEDYLVKGQIYWQTQLIKNIGRSNKNLIIDTENKTPDEISDQIISYYNLGKF